MSDISESLAVLIPKTINYRQVIMPNYQYGSFVGNDTDNHIYRLDARGKTKLTVAIHNATNKDLVATVYGMHSTDGDIGDTGTFELGGPGNGSFTITAASDWNYEVSNDPFPFYLVRCVFSAVPDGETVSIYMDLQD
jgi:hypothetical protein